MTNLAIAFYLQIKFAQNLAVGNGIYQKRVMSPVGSFIKIKHQIFYSYLYQSFYLLLN